MIRHCITEGLLAHPPHGATALQLRDKTASAHTLLERARHLRHQFDGPILVNDRIDICLAAQLDGVHLPSHRLAPNRLRSIASRPLTIGVSCHNLEEALAAESDGADYVYLSPIFPVAAKQGYGPALGLDYLAFVCRQISIPVLALGGIHPANELLCLQAGAAGIAGISYFLTQA